MLMSVVLASGGIEAVLRWALTGAYLLVLGLVCMYGLHRYWLTWVYYRTRGNVPQPARLFEQWPRVTVQLPMYNEMLVAQRVIEAACAIDYPADRLEVQVLDDSTDESAGIARQCVDRMRARGHDVQYIHRSSREGFKAGALNEGLKTARGELIAIFDADFVPPRDILKRTVHYFTDPGVGMVQTRWDHLNRDDSILTRSQAIFLDGHFVIEHTARNRSGRWINFNGTAGLWRRQTIESAGNWQHDTLTEDVDLSYRAQLADWRFIYLPGVTCPGELPPQTNAFKSQQHRWSKGSIQTAKKMLPRIIRSNAPLATKVEAFFHLTSPVVYLLVVLMILMFFPVIYLNLRPFESSVTAGCVFGLTLLTLATASAGVFYTASQRECGRGTLKAIAQIPMLMAIGIGISLNNARAVVEALIGHRSEFVRTPKYNATGADRSWRDNAPLVQLPGKWAGPLSELAMAGYLVACVGLSLATGSTAVSVPFLVLFAAGYFYVGVTSAMALWRGRAVRVAAAG